MENERRGRPRHLRQGKKLSNGTVIVTECDASGQLLRSTFCYSADERLFARKSADGARAATAALGKHQSRIERQGRPLSPAGGRNALYANTEPDADLNTSVDLPQRLLNMFIRRDRTALVRQRPGGFLSLQGGLAAKLASPVPETATRPRLNKTRPGSPTCSLRRVLAGLGGHRPPGDAERDDVDPGEYRHCDCGPPDSMSSHRDPP